LQVTSSTPYFATGLISSDYSRSLTRSIDSLCSSMFAFPYYPD
jgi:hypothetical protein